MIRYTVTFDMDSSMWLEFDEGEHRERPVVWDREAHAHIRPRRLHIGLTAEETRILGFDEMWAWLDWESAPGDKAWKLNGFKEDWYCDPAYDALTTGTVHTHYEPWGSVCIEDVEEEIDDGLGDDQIVDILFDIDYTRVAKKFGLEYTHKITA